MSRLGCSMKSICQDLEMWWHPCWRKTIWTCVLGAKHGIWRLINVDYPSHNGNPNNNGYLISHSSFDDRPRTWETSRHVEKPCSWGRRLRVQRLWKSCECHQDKAKDGRDMQRYPVKINWLANYGLNDFCKLTCGDTFLQNMINLCSFPLRIPNIIKTISLSQDSAGSAFMMQTCCEGPSD